MRNFEKKNIITLLVMVIFILIVSFFIGIEEQRARETFRGLILISNIKGLFLILLGIILGLDIFKAKWKGMKLTYDYKKAIILGVPLLYLAFYYYISLLPFNIIRMYLGDLDSLLILSSSRRIFQILLGYVLGNSLMKQENEFIEDIG